MNLLKLLSPMNWIAIIAVCLLFFSSGSYIGYRWNNSKVKALEVTIAKQETSMVKADNAALDAALKKQSELQAKANELQNNVNSLGLTYGKKLKDAQTKINGLESKLIAGNGRLHYNATIEHSFSGRDVSKAPGTTFRIDEATCRPSDSAQRNYLLLRERIEEVNLQIEGLQEYIKEINK